MLSTAKLIGSLEQVQESGKGLRFLLRDKKGASLPAFVIRFDGQFFAYMNKCGHIAVQLDYMPGEFFSDDGQTLMCATHGAEYAPDTGACLGGPCYGIGLEPLEINASNGYLYLQNSDYEVLNEEC
jgi:nitrite reductase/ring-hydroxylating ferredoxin subunit